MGFIPQSGQSAPPLINVCRGATLGPGREIAFSPSRAGVSLSPSTLSLLSSFFLDTTRCVVVVVDAPRR